jgi:hypothetical protein
MDHVAPFAVGTQSLRSSRSPGCCDSWEPRGWQRLIPLTQVRLYIVGASIPPGLRFCVGCLA